MAPNGDGLSHAEFLAHIEPIRRDVAEMVALQREANGRMAKAETRIAILEDRSPGRIGMMAGGAVAGLVTVLWQLIAALRK